MADPQTPAPPAGGPAGDLTSAGGPAATLSGAEGGAWNRRKWYILTAICVAQFMVVLDIAVVNVALPSIRSDLHFTVESLQWVLTAYAIFFGGFLLLGGRLADVLGRRRLFMTGLVLFSGASLACGFAWSEASLIVFRCIQGLGGALLSPAALSILVTTFAEGRERNLALGIWGGIAGSGAAAGTLLGGVLTSALGWQWIFYINVPIGAVLIGLSPFLLPASREGGARRGFDVPGAVTATAGLMLLVYALTRATQIGWGAGETIALLAVAAALLVAFAVIEVRSRHALLPLRILGLTTPRTANIVGFLIGAGLFSQFFLLSLYMQQVLHYSALKTGVAYIATTFLTVVSAIVAQGLVNRIGMRVVLPIGLALTAVAVLLYTRLPVNGSYVSDLLPGVPADRRRPGPGLRARLDRRTDGHPPARGRRRLGADQHEPADRRRRGTGGHHDDRHDRDLELPAYPPVAGRGGAAGRADARLPHRLLRAGRRARRGRRAVGAVHLL